MKVLILAGGKGTRLWPLSRNHKPKQFQKLLEEKTMFQATFERIVPLVSSEDIYIATSHFYEKEVKEQLPTIPLNNIILEPGFRERVAAFLLFLCYLKKDDFSKPVVILSSDHLIKNEQKFKKAIIAGKEFIEKNPNKILLLGEKPNSPNTGYGYIKKGEKEETIKNFNFFEVKHFKEKPDLKKATEYLKSKNYFWNVGIFIFIPALFEKLAKELTPNNYQRYLKIKKAFSEKNFKKILEEEYLKMDKLSFDVAILEKYQKNIILPISMGWSDIGSWIALKNCLTLDSKKHIQGNYINLDSKNIFIHNLNKKLVATIGVKNLTIVVTNDIILICDQKKSEAVKEIVEKLENENNLKYL